MQSGRQEFSSFHAHGVTSVGEHRERGAGAPGADPWMSPLLTVDSITSRKASPHHRQRSRRRALPVAFGDYSSRLCRTSARPAGADECANVELSGFPADDRSHDATSRRAEHDRRARGRARVRPPYEPAALLQAACGKPDARARIPGSATELAARGVAGVAAQCGHRAPSGRRRVS